MCQISKLFPKIIFLSSLTIYLGIFLSELVSFVYEPMGKLGVFNWFVAYLFLLLFSSYYLVKLVIRKRIFTLLTVGLIVFLILIDLTSLRNISGESTQETACALFHLNESFDLGFQQTCLFGYPAKGFLHTALLPFFIGRTHLALNLGEALIVIIGLIIFGTALSLQRKSVGSDLAGAIGLSFLLHINYYHYTLFGYQLTTAPFAIGLVLCGLFLLLRRQSSFCLTPLIGITLIFSIFSHTPSLAQFFLALIVLTYWGIKTRLPTRQRLFVFFIVISSLTVFILSLHYRQDINITDPSYTLTRLKTDLLTLKDIIFFHDQGKPIVTVYFQSIFLFTILASLTFVFGWQVFIIAAWIIATIVFSVISKGYSYYGIDYRLQRSVIVFPYLVTLLAYIGGKFRLAFSRKRAILFVTLLLFLSTGILNYRRYLTSKSESSYLRIIRLLEPTYKFTKNRVYFDNSLSHVYGSMNDYLKYFMPYTKGEIAAADCNNFNLSQEENIFLFTPIKPTGSECIRQRILQAGFRKIPYPIKGLGLEVYFLNTNVSRQKF